MPLKKVTYHASSLNSFWYIACIRFTPKNMALKVLVACVHNEGEGVDVLAYSHEGQEAHATLHHDLLFILLRSQRVERYYWMLCGTLVLIKWEDILIHYCDSFLSVWPKHAQAWAGSPPLGCHWGFEHYHRILKCCTLWKLLVLWRNQQHGYMGTMTPKYAPLSLVCYRDVGLVPHQKTYIKYSISKSHCTKLYGKCSTFSSVTQIFILLLAPIPRVRQMQFGI